MTTEITIPTTLHDRACNEIKATTQRTNPNLTGDALRQYVEDMFDLAWGAALSSFTEGARRTLEATEKAFATGDTSRFTPEDLETLRRSAARARAQSLESMRSIHSIGLTVMLQNSGMKEATAKEIVTTCFFPPAVA